MTSTSFTKTAAVALTAVIASGFFFAPTDANAKGGRGAVSIDTYEFKNAHEGFEGSTGNAYCSYRKVPKRRCFSKNGKRSCKVVGWKLKQICQSY